MHEYISVSLLLGWRIKDILLPVFTLSCRFSKGAFCGKSPISMGRNGRLKPVNY